MIADIVALAEKLFGLRESLRGLRREKRADLAGYLRKIAACLEDAERDLRGGGSAALACGRLHKYVELIPPAVHKALGEQQTADLREQLKRALHVRALHPSPDGLDHLLEAAGSFIALADYLEVNS